MKKLLSVLFVIIMITQIFSVNKMVFADDGFEVEHFFTHCLIVNPQKAFNDSNYMSKHYDIDCLTTIEFENILKSLYKNNYCLINANECFEILKNGQAVKKNIKLPNQKKPFILSIDDVNYDHKKLHLGMADKISVDENGKLCSIIDGKIDYEKEFVSVLNNFIEKHPDFSHNGARAMLCLTGYDGILGYRTIGNNSEKQQAKRVIDALKQDGYYFACHSFGHYHMKKLTTLEFETEILSFKNEVESLIGKTNIYVYPYGEYEIIKDGKISEKHRLLVENGFKLFCGVGAKHFYSYLPFNTARESQVLFMDRKPLDGYSLRELGEYYKEFFISQEVYDKKNRKVSFN